MLEKVAAIIREQLNQEDVEITEVDIDNFIRAKGLPGSV